MASAQSVFHLEDAASAPTLHAIHEVLALQGHSALPGLSSEETRSLRRVALWAQEYVSQPHPELGRSGNVCPWVPGSMRSGKLFFSVLSANAAQLSVIEHEMLQLKERFLALEPVTGRGAQLKTIICLLPSLPPDMVADVMVTLHTRLKRFFVEQGLMLGEFYATCSKPGLHNPHFRPLQSSVPLLVIRTMVENDIAFLNDERQYASAYLRKFGTRGYEGIRNYLEEHRSILPPEQAAMLCKLLQEYGGRPSARAAPKGACPWTWLRQALGQEA